VSGKPSTLRQWINVEVRLSKAVIDRSQATAIALGLDGLASVSQIVGCRKRTAKAKERAGAEVSVEFAGSQQPGGLLE
jgi:hypothetical protein